MRRLPDDEYKQTWSYKLRQWFDGSDLFIDNVEMHKQTIQKERPEDLKRQQDEHDAMMSRVYSRENGSTRGFQIVYRVVSVCFCVFLAAVLLLAVSWLPATGTMDRPVNNEVYTRYIEDGLEETGAVNAVTGMILDYRAFDTLGESHVLFTATLTVLILLRVDSKKYQKKNTKEDWKFAQRDGILEMGAKLLVPVTLIFGIYVILCGHLGPGGGFSGGAIIGAGLILYQNSFGARRAGEFLTDRLYLGTSFVALACYTGCKAYSFYTGANGIESIIGLGTPGAILSSGLIFILNICVGVVVAGTMYTIYAMFSRGGY